MCAGYIARLISINSPHELGPYLFQTLFIILPPSLYAATIYMLYGRIVFLVDAADLSLIRPTWVTKVFVAGDLFSFILQAGGGSMLTVKGQETLGKNVLLGGLFFQLLSFGFFLVVSGMFYFRVERSGRPMVPNYAKYHWTTEMKILYLAAGLIIFRCIFRVFEFEASADSPVRDNEIYAYCLDAVPMLGVQAVFNFFHGGMIIPSTGVPSKGDRSTGQGSEYELTRGEV